MGVSLYQLSLVLAYSLFMAVGQVLFKYVSLDLNRSGSFLEAAADLPFKLSFWAVGALYGLSMIYWIWVLTRVPLNIAYPVASVALLLVPLLSWFLFAEALSVKYWAGLLMIIGGVILVAR